MRLLYFIITICFCISCGQVQTKKDDVFIRNDSIAYKADLYLNKLTNLKKFNGVVLLKKGNEVLLERAYNLTSDSLSSLYVTNGSQFDLRSVAKLFAKISLVKLVEEGKIDSNDKLQKFIPDFPKGDIITINHLATNTSGLPREFSVENTLKLNPNEIVQLASKEELEFEPGTEERYSNVGFQLLYYIIGKQEGSGYSSFLKSKFFNPLGMVRTGGNFDRDLSHLTNYAYGHYLNENKEIVCDSVFLQDEVKMGNLHSTMNDLSLLLKSLDSTTYKTILHKGKISHAGGTRGKRAYVERDFVDDFTIIFLANYDAIPFQKLIADLQKILKEEPIKFPERIERSLIKLDVSILEKYAGEYDFVDAGHLRLKIKIENDSLSVYQNGRKAGVLYPETESVFFAEFDSDESFEFVKNDMGEYFVLMDFKGVRWKGIKVP